MFPAVRVIISGSGLLATSKYSITLEFNPVDQFHYRYVHTEWVHAGEADEICEDRICYVHPDSPAKGKFWVTRKVSFSDAHSDKQ